MFVRTSIVLQTPSTFKVLGELGETIHSRVGDIEVSSDPARPQPDDYDDHEAADFSDYPDVELCETVKEDICDGVSADVQAAVYEFLHRHWSPMKILQAALLPGLRQLSHEYQTGAISMDQVQEASLAFQAGLTIVQAHQTALVVNPVGHVLLAGVEGDAHSFGLDICALYLQAEELSVQNLGCNQTMRAVITAVHRFQPDVLVMTTMLSVTRPRLRIVLQALGDVPLPRQPYVLVGGGAVDEQHAVMMQADAFAPDWPTAVDLILTYLNSQGA